MGGAIKHRLTERAKIQSTPGSVDEALDALEADHHFLLKGDVFTKDADLCKLQASA
jgi:hypothetical protein